MNEGSLEALMFETSLNNHKQQISLLTALSAAAAWTPKGGSLPALEDDSVHIYPSACLYGRIDSLLSQPFPIHVFYPENKKRSRLGPDAQSVIFKVVTGAGSSAGSTAARAAGASARASTPGPSVLPLPRLFHVSAGSS